MDDLFPLTISDFQRAYREGRLTLADTVRRILSFPADGNPVWICRLDEAALMGEAKRLDGLLSSLGMDKLPLFGVPFAVKDNIDAAGLPTTAACPEFAYTPTEDSYAVSLLKAAGALLVGKTNLDQFATGLSGARSPYGSVRNAFDPRYVSGGSSSGSAVACARLEVAFALGTDTAGSGRVPAGFNNVVGLKPSRGRVSTQGVVPACRSLDCVSVFALDVADAETVLAVLDRYDPEDAYARRPGRADCCPPLEAVRLAVPDRLDFQGDALAERAFASALGRLRSILSCPPPGQFDLDLAQRMSALLYSGPWVAERDAAFGEFARLNPRAMHPVVARVVAKAADFSATDAFQAEYQRRSLAMALDGWWNRFDVLVVPTAPTIYRVDEMEADPIRLNTRLGTYTNFVNLADWTAIALPAGFRGDGLPHGITLIAPAWAEDRLLAMARAWQNGQPWNLGVSDRPAASAAANGRFAADAPTLATVAVVGAHMSGMPLNGQLVERGGRLARRDRTAPRYRLFRLPGANPAKPGLAKVGPNETGNAIDLEIWQLPMREYGSFVSLVPPPLCIGSIELADGSAVQGFLAEAHALGGADDISRFGGWRAYIEASNPGA